MLERLLRPENNFEGLRVSAILGAMAHKKKGSLTEELGWYESHKAEWLPAQTGKFALVGGQHLAGFYSTYEQAFEAGLQEFGLDAEFLIKQVADQDPVFVIY